MIGKKIKKIRELRGLTQKELGLKTGFPYNSADVRMRQYESEKKILRDDAIKALTSALEIDEASLYRADISSFEEVAHILMDIEAKPIEINGIYYLQFSNSTYPYDAMLRSWGELEEKYSDEELYLKKQSFFRDDESFSKCKKMEEMKQLQIKQQELQRQIDEIAADLETAEKE